MARPRSRRLLLGDHGHVTASRSGNRLAKRRKQEIKSDLIVSAGTDSVKNALVRPLPTVLAEME